MNVTSSEAAKRSNHYIPYHEEQQYVGGAAIGKRNNNVDMECMIMKFCVILRFDNYAAYIRVLSIKIEKK
jgi:hypothetical protein